MSCHDVHSTLLSFSQRALFFPSCLKWKASGEPYQASTAYYHGVSDNFLVLLLYFSIMHWFYFCMTLAAFAHLNSAPLSCRTSFEVAQNIDEFSSILTSVYLPCLLLLPLR